MRRIEMQPPWSPSRTPSPAACANPLDRYVIDCFCQWAGLAVEICGRQHDAFSDYDQGRTEALEAARAHVVRFTHDEMCNDLESVLERIIVELSLPYE